MQKKHTVSCMMLVISSEGYMHKWSNKNDCTRSRLGTVHDKICWLIGFHRSFQRRTIHLHAWWVASFLHIHLHVTTYMSRRFQYRIQQKFSSVLSTYFSWVASTCIWDELLSGFLNEWLMYFWFRQHGMNEVNARWARLVLGRVTIFERAYHLGV